MTKKSTRLLFPLSIGLAFALICRPAGYAFTQPPADTGELDVLVTAPAHDGLSALNSLQLSVKEIAAFIQPYLGRQTRLASWREEQVDTVSIYDHRLRQKYVDGGKDGGRS